MKTNCNLKVFFSALCFIIILNKGLTQVDYVYTLSKQDRNSIVQLYKKCLTGFTDSISLDDKTTFWNIANNHGGDIKDIQDFSNLKSFDFANLNLYMRAFYEDAMISIEIKKPFKSKDRLELESKFDPKFSALLKKNDSLMIQISKEIPINYEGLLILLNEQTISEILENIDGKIKFIDDNINYLETPIESKEREYLILSKSSYSDSKFANAKKWIDSAILLSLNNGSYYFLRGIYNRALNQLQDALIDFNKSILLDDLNYQAYNQRGATFSDIKLINEAIADYKISIQINPKINSAYNNLGQIYLEKGDYGNAIFYFDFAVNSYYNGKTYYNRGLAQYQLNHDYKKVIKDMDSALLLDQSITDAYYNRGLCNSMLKKYKMALKDFNKTIEMSVNHEYALLNRGVVLANLKQYDNACKDFKKAYSLGNTSAKAYMEKVCNRKR